PFVSRPARSGTARRAAGRRAEYSRPIRSYSDSGDTPRLRDLEADALHRLERLGFAHLAEVDDALAEGVELLAPDDRVAGDAALATARRDLAYDLADERLRIDAPL